MGYGGLRFLLRLFIFGFLWLVWVFLGGGEVVCFGFCGGFFCLKNIELGLRFIQNVCCWLAFNRLVFWIKLNTNFWGSKYRNLKTWLSCQANQAILQQPILAHWRYVEANRAALNPVSSLAEFLSKRFSLLYRLLPFVNTWGIKFC